MPRFTADDLVPPDEVDLKGIRPFKKGEFLDNQDGTHSTERTVTFEDEEGREVVFPSLWMTRNGPVDLSRNPEALTRARMQFEKSSKKKFPRFDSKEEAEAFAIDRSNQGGVSGGKLESSRQSGSAFKGMLIPVGQLKPKRKSKEMLLFEREKSDFEQKQDFLRKVSGKVSG